MDYKGYKIELQREYAIYGIRSIGKGALPKLLQGAFTTYKDAMKVIDIYLDSKAQN
jgi:hypothetical protein